MRCIVIADAHAQPWLISNALEHSHYDKKEDRLIFAGDFLDVGIEPDKCFDILEEQGAEMLFGNHEVSVLLNKPVTPQSLVSWEYQAMFEKLVRDPEQPWKVATAHDGVLITHAGVSQVYHRALYGYEEMGADYVADYFNKRFELILDVPEIALDFWANDSPLWFRPGLMAPLPGIVQVAGHTPAEMLPKDENYYSVDPYSRHNFSRDRYRYAEIIDGDVQVYDSNDVE
jgi:predicted phosphodiesterase